MRCVNTVNRESITSELRQDLAAAARANGCELLASELAGGVLRLVLDHADGVTLEHCESVSRQVSALLDVTDFGPSRYVLEVTSPGLDRKFYRAEDYSRFLGRRVRVTWQTPDMERKQTVTGRLEAYRPAPGEIDLVDDEKGAIYTISLENIRLTRLEPDL